MTIFTQKNNQGPFWVNFVSVWDRSHDSKARIFFLEIQNEALNVFYFHFRMPPNQMALYPNWLIVYVLRVIVPMLMLFIIAVKILLKYGREIKRAFDIEQRYGWCNINLHLIIVVNWKERINKYMRPLLNWPNRKLKSIEDFFSLSMHRKFWHQTNRWRHYFCLFEDRRDIWNRLLS